MISTTLDGFIVSTNVNPKNNIENITVLNPLNIGCIPILNVVAPVLGIAKSRPRPTIIAVANTKDNIFSLIRAY